MFAPRLSVLAFVLSAVVTPAFADQKSDALDYVTKSVAPQLKEAKPVLDAIVKANADRTAWGEYSADWKKWTVADAGKQPEGYAKAEYRWSGQKDKAFREHCTSGEAATLLKGVQEKSGGKIGEFFVVDAKGGNVAQTQATSDFFQGDEDKFTKVSGKKEPWADEPKRDDTIGKTAVQVSLPLWTTTDGKETFIGVAVVTVLVDAPTASAEH